MRQDLEGSLPKLEHREEVLGEVVEGERLEHLRLFVVVVSVYPGGGLLETDVVEPLETGPLDRCYLVVRNQEMLFPSHVHEIRVFDLIVIEIVTVEGVSMLQERRKLGPMLLIDLQFSFPFPRQKWVFLADDLSFKVCGQGRILLREVVYLEISTQEITFFVNMLKNYIYLVAGYLAPLLSPKSSPGMEERRGYASLLRLDAVARTGTRAAAGTRAVPAAPP